VNSAGLGVTGWSGGYAAAVGGESDMTAPMIAVMMPMMKRSPPKRTKAKSVMQPWNWPDRIVPKHEDAESKPSRGPETTITIPIRNTRVRNVAGPASLVISMTGLANSLTTNDYVTLGLTRGIFSGNDAL
jgi:hypothetical protein